MEFQIGFLANFTSSQFSPFVKQSNVGIKIIYKYKYKYNQIQMEEVVNMK